MNTIFIIIISVIFFDFLLNRVLKFLNLKHMSLTLPAEAEGIYDADKYRKYQEYHMACYNFGMIKNTFFLMVTLAILFFDIIPMMDSFARSYTENPIWVALIFFGIFTIINEVMTMPFTLYSTFVIDEKFGFNTSTLKIFIMDKLKGYVLLIILGGGVSAGIIWIYVNTGKYFWVAAWGATTLYAVFMNIIYTPVILPLFNKLTPLPDGGLRTAVEAYCKKVGFKLKNIYIINSSKRTTETNACITGLGSQKKIILNDTILEKHSIEEVVAIIAHEAGHSKKKHITKGVVFSFLQTGAIFFLMSLFLGNPELSHALGVEKPSFHVGIIAFQYLYAPFDEIISIILNIFSRRREFEADAYAKETYSGEQLKTALKKMGADNLDNLKPHPAYVFVNYSHPPLLERLKRLD